MGDRRGLFVVFEGIDGAGTSTQVPLLTSYIKKLSKYNDVLETHEPWRSDEIKRRLECDRDAFADGDRMARLYIEDRESHSSELIKPNIDNGVFVLSDRYKISTCAYQWAQGVDLGTLLKMHENRGLVVPDLTFFVDVSRSVAEKRLALRGCPREKFEGNRDFTDRLISCYRDLWNMSLNAEKLFGMVVLIDGEGSVGEVAEKVRLAFDPLYDSWKANKVL